METWTLIGIGIFAVVTIAILAVSRSKTKRIPIRQIPLGQSDIEKRVLTQMRGDHAMVERLVKSKQIKYPNASRQKLLEMVHEDYISDNR